MHCVLTKKKSPFEDSVPYLTFFFSSSLVVTKKHHQNSLSIATVEKGEKNKSRRFFLVLKYFFIYTCPKNEKLRR